MTPFPRDGLRGWFAELLQLPESNVVFEDEPEPIVGPKGGAIKGICHLSIVSDGTDLWEDRWAQDGAGATVTSVSVDTVAVNVVYESFVSPKELVANDVLTRARVKGWQEYFRDRLMSFGVVLIDAAPATRVSVSVDALALSAAQLEMTFRFTQTDEVMEVATDFIEAVDIFGTVGGGGDLQITLDDSVTALPSATALTDNVTGLPAVTLASSSSPSSAASSVSVSLA